MTTRGRAVVRVLAVACLIGAVVLLLGARPSGAAKPPRQTVAKTAATPVWSARRLPSLFNASLAGAALTRDLSAIVAPYAACVDVDDASGAVTRINSTTPLAPASNQKLLTAAAALATMKPDEHFTTRALLDANGNLVIVGGGDPLLRTNPTPNQLATPLDDLARAIAASGVHSVGTIGVDDTRYDGVRLLPDWKPNYIPDNEVGPLGALTVDRGFVLSPRRQPAPDPAILTGNALRSMLEAHGVSVSGGVQHVTAPPGAREIAHVDSPRLDAIVEEMLRDSNNYSAEMLTRELGYRRAHPGSTPAGDAAIVGALGPLGIPTAGVTLHDGSGLAPDNRVTCDALAAVIGLSSQSKFAPINRGLPVAGQTGTLAARFLGDPLAGVLRAKTGTIDNVVGFSGTIDNTAHPRFSFLANGNFTRSAGEGLQAAIAREIATYPQPVDTGALVPKP